MKAAIYGRVSTEKQEEQNTIESQLHDLKLLIEQNGDALIESYVDNGYSGSLLARPALDKLRDDAKTKLFDRVYIHSPDRLSRKYAYQVIVLDDMKKYGIEVIFKNRKAADTPEDNMLLGIQGIIAEYEKVKIVERTRRGRLYRARTNHIVGNIPPYGYYCISKNKSENGFAFYEINPDEAKVVKQMFLWLIDEGLTTYKIIDRLQISGIKPRKGKRWARSTVHKILRNETYSGITFYNKHFYIPSTKDQEKGKYTRKVNTVMRLRPQGEWIPINVPAIITKEIFNRAKQQLEQNAQLSDRNTKHEYLLKGLIKCSKDMGSMHGIPNHGKRYYRCYFKNKLNSPTPCTSSIVKANKVEEIVWSAFADLLSNPTHLKEQYGKWMRNKAEKHNELLRTQHEVLDVEKKLTQLKHEEDKMLLAFRGGALTIEQLKEQNQHIQKERQRLTQISLLRKNESIKPTYEPKETDFTLFASLFKPILNRFDFEKKRFLLRKSQISIIVSGNMLKITGAIPTRLNAQLCPQSPPEGSSGSR